MKKRPITGIAHPHLKILKKSGYADVARVLEYDGDVMSIPAERWDEVAGFLRAMPYGSTLRDIAEHRARWVRQQVRKNPPMYAHNLYEKKTHGLNLKQMRRLYAMVSRGNQKAITYARNVLGIPFSESPSQVKAVVLHHVRDLAERKVRRNPGGYVIGYGPDPYSVYDVIAESKDGSRYIAFYMLTRSEAKKQAERLKKNLGEKTYVVYHPRDREGKLLGHPSSLLKGTRYYNDFYKYVRKNPMEYDVLRDKFEVMGGPITDKMQSILRKIYNMRDAGKSEAQLRPFIKEYQRLKGLVTPLRRNPARSHRERIAIDTVRHPMKGYFLGGPDLAESVRYLRSLGYSMAQLKKINPEVEDILEGRKSILPNRRRRRK